MRGGVHAEDKVNGPAIVAKAENLEIKKQSVVKKANDSDDHILKVYFHAKPAQNTPFYNTETGKYDNTNEIETYVTINLNKVFKDTATVDGKTVHVYKGHGKNETYVGIHGYCTSVGDSLISAGYNNVICNASLDTETDANDGNVPSWERYLGTVPIYNKILPHQSISLDSQSQSYIDYDTKRVDFYFTLPEGEPFQSITTDFPNITKSIKTTDGKGLADSQQFNFSLQQVGNAPQIINNNSPVETVSVDVPSGKTTGSNSDIGKLSFTEPGIYKYTVKEVQGDDKNFNYDDKERTVEFNVHYNKYGQLVIGNQSYEGNQWNSDNFNEYCSDFYKKSIKADVTVKKDDQPTENNEINFINEYNPSIAAHFPEATVSINKDTSAPRVNAANFEIKVQPDDNSPSVSEPSKTVTIAKDQNSENVSFGQLAFNKPGTYSYTVSEIKGNEQGYKYDDQTEFKVTYNVSLVNGALTCTSAVTKGGKPADNIIFENEYHPDPVWPEFPKALSSITGDDRSEEASFDINVKPLENSPEIKDLIKTVTIAKDRNSGTADFGRIKFTKSGKYHYEVSESKGSQEGYTYDQTKYIVEFNVTDAGGYLTSELSVKKGNDVADKIEFENQYNRPKKDPTESPSSEPSGPNLITVDDPPVSKTIAGDKPSKDSIFYFIMRSDNPSYPMPKGSDKGIKIVSHKGTGSVEFGDITFTEPGTYTYTILEQNDHTEGYRFDTSAYKVIYAVSKNSDGGLTSNRTITKNGIQCDTAEFVNYYTSSKASSSSSFSGKKEASVSEKKKVGRKKTEIEAPNTRDKNHTPLFGFMLITSIAVIMIILRERRA